MESLDFLVCVRCFTFNHAKYIEDAMNGFTMQQTDFPFVCVIVDDASTDGEPEIIRNYLQEHFDLSDDSVVKNKETDDYLMTFAQHKTNKNCFFAVYYLKYNHYSSKITKMGYIAKFLDNAKYQALCEGDDYWIDSGKLEKQINLMERDESVGLVYTKANLYNQDKRKTVSTIGKEIKQFDDLLIRNDIPTLSTCFKTDLYNKYVNSISSEFKGFSMGDYPIWLYIYSISKIAFIDESTCIYRELSESASHSKSYDRMKKFHEDERTIKYYFLMKEKSKVEDIERVVKGIEDYYAWMVYRDSTRIYNDYSISDVSFEKLNINHKILFFLLYILSIFGVRK